MRKTMDRDVSSSRLRNAARVVAIAAAATSPLISTAWAQEADGAADMPSAAATAEDATAGEAVPGGMTVAPTEPSGDTGGFFGFPFDGRLPIPRSGSESGRDITLTPAITGQVMATDNVFPGTRRKEGDIVTTITPELRIAADTLRLQGGLVYAPSFRHYAFTSSEDRIDHRLSGSALATILPGSLFLDVRGSAAVIPVNGGLPNQDADSVPRSNRSQTANLSATPYYLQRFGGWATALAGYTYQYGRQGGPQRSLVPGGPAVSKANDFSSDTVFAAVRTGEEFGQVALEARVTATNYNGTGVLDGASRRQGLVEGRYAFTRSIFGIAEIGYETQEYGGMPPRDISEPIWAVGARFEPSPSSYVMARYQHRDGYDSPTLDARMTLTPSTILFARYSDQIGTNLQQNANLLRTTMFDEFGNPVDTQSGEPTRSFGGSTLLAQQNALFRNRRLTTTLSQTWERDTVALTLGWDERTPVATAAGDTAFAQKGLSAGVSWTHVISEAASIIASLQHGWLESSPPGATGGSRDSTNYSVRATYLYRFNPTLTASVQYRLTNRSDDFTSSDFSGSSLQNALIVTMRKSF